MKSLFIFLVGIAVGAYGLHYYQDHIEGASPTRADAGPVVTQPTRPTVVDNARNTAVSTRDAISDKLAQWHLTPDEIKDDLARTGSVVRTKAQAAGQSIAAATSNARIVTVIKAKYTLDSQLSARNIDVDCIDGKVTLRGTVASQALIGKAIAHALDTDGVKEVSSLLTVAP